MFSLGLSASYDFDIFGGSRRELEALAAEVDYQAYELEGARLTLASNVVATAIRQAAIAAADRAHRVDPGRAAPGARRGRGAVRARRRCAGGRT